MSDMSSAQRLRVFISYSRKNGPFAEDLLTALETCGFDAYIDKRDIVPGEPWEERLERLIQSADSIAFVISTAFIASPRCTWEIDKAAGLGKRLMPVVVEAVPDTDVPEKLRRLNYTLFAGEGRTFAKGLADLSKALNTDLAWIREHTRLADLAERWRSRNRGDAMLMRGEEIAAAKTWIARQPKDAPSPTLLQRDFIATSEKVELNRLARERAQEAVAKDAEIARIRAENDLKAAKQEADRVKAERRRRQLQATLGMVLVLAAIGLIVGYRELDSARKSEATNKRLLQAEKLNSELQRRIAQAEQQASVLRPEQSPEAKTAAAAQPSTTALESIRTVREVSPAAIDLLASFEIGGRLTYERLYARPEWPGGASGINIGIGYDLGYYDAEQFKGDWGDRLPDTHLVRLERALGVRGELAKALAANLTDIEIPWDVAMVVFQTRTLPRFAMLVDQNLPNANLLPSDSYGALVSLVFNRGARFTADGDRLKEMRAIRDLMAQKRFKEIPEQLRSMKRLWPQLEGLRNRREAEALLFEKGLAAAGTG